MKNSNVKLPHFKDNIYYFNHGNHTKAYSFLGSQRIDDEGNIGYQFSVWAPNADKVMIQGDFTQWKLNDMHKVPGGVWTIYFPEDLKGQHYKYAIDNGRGHVEYKIDPYAFRFEKPPKDSSIVWDNTDFDWSDDTWLRSRRMRNLYENPMQIYEVHASSWRKHPNGTNYTFQELADSLIPYVLEMGYTHIEFMPLMDHPLEASWGYQITGYYAVSARYGTVDEFKDFVNQAHKAGIGVMIDWVPGHYSKNANALAYYDGTPTYESADFNKANNVGWGTLNFDLGKPQVQSFLISNALYWIREFHLDGMRVDAVSNMLYLDFGEGKWTPNEDGSNDYRDGVAFLKKLNTAVHQECPDVLMMAEESTNWAGVTKPVSEGGLGFDYKWNMGWMNDTLKFFEMDPLYRSKNMQLITFVFVYQYKERYILPYSHDEVVHGKNSMLGKLPGDRYNQFATLRLIHGYMMAQPGKLLHFMGNELGQFLEWRFYEELEWVDLTRPYNSEYQYFIKTINHIGQQYPAFYQLDHDPAGITVLSSNKNENAVLSFIRHGKNPRDFIVIVCNFVPFQREELEIGVPYRGTYEVILNSEMKEFGGVWEENIPDLVTTKKETDGQPYTITTVMPAASVLYIRPKRVYGVNK